MKRISWNRILCGLLSLLGCSWLMLPPSLAATWELVLNGGMEDRSIHQVHFITPEQGWAVGWEGTSFWTEDGGETWTRRELGISHRASFPTPLDGWQPLPGFITITEAPYPPIGLAIPFQRSFDGGLSWQEMTGIVTDCVELKRPSQPQPYLPVSFQNVMFHFLNPNVGFMTGTTEYWIDVPEPGGPRAWNFIGRTEDGGQTWQLLLNWGEPRALAYSLEREVHFVDDTHGWVLHRTPFMLYRTQDGGRSWQALPYPGYVGKSTWVRRLAFISSSQGWLVAGVLPDTQVWSTMDGGESWRREVEGYPLAEARSVLFLNSQEGFAAHVDVVGQPTPEGFRGVLHTTDGGYTWEPEFDISDIEPLLSAQWHLSFDPLTQSVWFSGSTETLYQRTGVLIISISPRDKQPVTWGQLRLP